MKTVLKYLMAVLYIAAGINHFVNPGFYENIMPPYIPLPYEMVILSGVAEILLGALLLVPRFQRIAAWGIILIPQHPPSAQRAAAPLAEVLRIRYYLLTLP